MADISKCLISEQCAQKERCYRHTAPDTPFAQSYTMPLIGPLGCQSFWANEGYTKAANVDNKQQ